MEHLIMIRNHQDFIEAIHQTKKIKIVFFSKEDNGDIERTCAPMDYAVGQNIKDNIERYWVWDYDSDTKKHTLGIRPERIKLLVVLDENFDPAEFVTWTPNWNIFRQWGQFS